MKNFLLLMMAVLLSTVGFSQNLRLNVGAGVSAQDGDFHVAVKVSPSYQIGLDFIQSRFVAGASVNLFQGYRSTGDIRQYEDANIVTVDLKAGYKICLYDFINRNYQQEISFTPIVGTGITALGSKWGVHALVGGRFDVDVSRNMEIYTSLYLRKLPENLDGLDSIYADVSLTAALGVSIAIGK